MKLVYPQVHIDSKHKIFISFYLNNKRYRLFNGKRIGSNTDPNSFPFNQREDIGRILAAEVYTYLINGGVLKEYRTQKICCGKVSDMEYLKQALDNKLNGDYSIKYKDMLQFVYDSLTKEINGSKVLSEDVNKALSQYSSGVSHNTIRRHLNVLINEAQRLGMNSSPMQEIKSRKSKAVLHKPFKNIKDVLEDIQAFNQKLYLCCLLTYGCLLRPHREIRLLSWGDFSEDLNYINLSGDRIKSGKNRIVPVPYFIRKELEKSEQHFNIFSRCPKAHNKDYFKTLWSRYKKLSNLVEDNHTLYSFRHSGAINVFERTGSLTKLKEAMGHSSLNVSLTYLRGLEVPQLKEEDMPVI